ncbi:hypothetical protein B0H13DRAFT_2311841 [Mycena leptocephala]|nr:hypothetical protein B0H13DRAFT_2311841 [Mycena leptocephala]
MPCLQIASFPVSDAFLSNPGIFKAPLDAIKTADGHISSFYGLQVKTERPAISFSLGIVRTSPEVHSGASYANLIETLKPAVSGKLERDHINVVGDVDTALSSPPSNSSCKGLDVAVGAHPPCAWGQSVEHKSKFLLVVGWDTVAAHWEAVKEGTALHGTIVQIKALADLSIGHSTTFKKHQG